MYLGTHLIKMLSILLNLSTTHIKLDNDTGMISVSVFTAKLLRNYYLGRIKYIYVDQLQLSSM